MNIFWFPFSNRPCPQCRWCPPYLIQQNPAVPNTEVPLHMYAIGYVTHPPHHQVTLQTFLLGQLSPWDSERSSRPSSSVCSTNQQHSFKRTRRESTYLSNKTNSFSASLSFSSSVISSIWTPSSCSNSCPVIGLTLAFTSLLS